MPFLKKNTLLNHTLQLFLNFITDDFIFYFFKMLIQFVLDKRNLNLMPWFIKIKNQHICILHLIGGSNLRKVGKG